MHPNGEAWSLLSFWLTIFEWVCFYWLIPAVRMLSGIYFLLLRYIFRSLCKVTCYYSYTIKIKTSCFIKAASVLKIYFSSVLLSSFCQTYWRVYSQVLSTQQRCLIHLCLLTCSKLTQVKTLYFPYHLFLSQIFAVDWNKVYTKTEIGLEKAQHKNNL